MPWCFLLIMKSSRPFELCAAVVAAVCLSHAEAAPAHSLHQTDARRWVNHAKALASLTVTDLTTATPATAFTKGKRERGKWKAMPFATEKLEGWALSCYAGTGAPMVKVPLPREAKGWHAVYIGLVTTSNGFLSTRNGIKAKLGDEKVCRHMSNNLPMLPERRDAVQEVFLTVAELTGEGPRQTVEISPLPGNPATVAYVRAIPLTNAEVKTWESEVSGKKATRTSIATFDGHSWIWPYKPQTAADLEANFRGFEHSDVGKWWFQVIGADLVCYPTKVGTLPGEGETDFNSGTNAVFTGILRSLIAKGINPLKVARDAARAQGAEFHVMIRPAGWQAGMPLEEAFNSKFYAAHPEWRCVDRDGTPTMYMSYAVPEVRQQVLAIYKETLELQPDGVGILFHRGMPMMLWEDAFSTRFQKKYNADARAVPEDDPRLLELRAEIMTEFLTEIRSLLDETAKAQGRTKPYTISLGTFSKEEDNRKFGIDLPTWIAKGLVDELGVAWFAHHTSFSQPDMTYYSRITRDSKVKVYPFVIAWKSGKPQELCKAVSQFYAQGAAGIAIWDPQVERNWPDGYAGNAFDTFGRLGHREEIAAWAKQGVPKPEAIPLKRLGENHYSRWFPTTGF